MKRIDYQIINGDALAEMAKLPAASIDAVITDLPYGTTACSWDVVIPFEPMWKELKRLVKPKSAIVLFGSQPFTSALIMSNLKMFRYEWIWQKGRPTDFFNSKNKPLKKHENILVFSDGTIANKSTNLMTYNPQNITKVSITYSNKNVGGDVFGARPSRANGTNYKQEFSNYPHTILDFSEQSKFHPTQKPVDLLRYLVRTYTKEGETVLDFTAGSFSTGVACAIENRNFIGIEINEKYCEIGKARIERAMGNPVEMPKQTNNLAETPLFPERAEGF